ncbi:factor activating pos9 [Tulasnella sp. 417]|nr:factor activating pos9 [Tulasnella sp. 417]
MPDVEGSERRLPNIVITGTPGTGKSTHAQLLVDASPVPLRHLNVSEIAKEKKLYENYDEEWQTYIVDEDKARPADEALFSHTANHAGGLVIDWHTCDVFPERWVDLVVVLRCDHTLLWDRLEKRGYSLKKIQENNESEIMQTVLDDAKESYAEEIVVELRSESTEDLESNVDRIVSWIQNWRRDRGFSDHST